MPPLVCPERSAHAAIRGYLYQTCLGVLRWLELEGDEDLDRLLRDGTGVSEQVKAYTGRLSVRDRAVRDSLRAFAVTYAALRRDGADRRFVFTTTAEKRRPRRGVLDLVEVWNDPERRDDVIAELRELLPKTDDEHVARAFAWLDAAPGRWASFIDAVEWHFEAKPLDGVRAEVEEKLRGRGLLPTAAHVDRLIAELLQASSQADVARRCRTSQDLEDLLRTMDEELARWAATPRAVALRAVFDEVAELGRLLHDGTRELRPDPSPGHLLIAAHEVVPFHSDLRRAELDALATWCDDDARASVWLWTGEGGAGKTRLMIEWCRQLRAQGWHADFLHRYLDGDVAHLAGGKAPRLVVVDYAGTRQDVVGPLLYKLATTPHGPRCRVVLLAHRETDWWRILREDDADVEQLIAASPGPRELAALDAGRAEVFREAAAAFSEATELEGDEADAPALERAGLDRVLYLHMAALASVGGERIEDARDALAKTLEHERHFWTRQVDTLVHEEPQKHLLGKAIPRAVTALTLTGGATVDGAARLLGAATEGLALRKDLRATLDELFLRPLYGDGGRLGGLEPDLLGEELVASCLASEPSLLDRVLNVADAGERASALTVLTRLASRRPDEERWLAHAFEGHLEELAEPALAVAVEVGDPVGRLLAGFVAGASGELAERLMKRCDADDYWASVPLREVACEATRRRLEVYLESWPKPNEAQLEELWRIANNFGERLRYLGRREDALEATFEALKLLRRLAAFRPDAFLPNVATNLHNLGIQLSALGRHHEAFEAAREAVEIRRWQAASQDSYVADLARSLSSLGLRLRALDRFEEALDATREAVEIRRPLAASEPDSHLPDFAASLTNLGMALNDLEQYEEAFEATSEAVDILRHLARSRPDAFLPDLANSLHNLGAVLSHLGRRKEALEATSEAVEIRRRLAASRPDGFLPNLAASLANLGKDLSALGRREEAVKAAVEAVQTLAPFFERLPEAFGEQMRIFVFYYHKLAVEAGHPVDGELLGPILERLDEDAY